MDSRSAGKRLDYNFTSLKERYQRVFQHRWSCHWCLESLRIGSKEKQRVVDALRPDDPESYEDALRGRGQEPQLYEKKKRLYFSARCPICQQRTRLRLRKLLRPREFDQFIEEQYPRLVAVPSPAEPEDSTADDQD